MKPINVAISSLTHAHVRKYYTTLVENPKLNWIAVSCPDEAIANHFNSLGYGIPLYSTLEEMLERHPEIDAVVLASENSRHMEEVKTCCQYKKHILSMKIPTFDMDEYDQMIKLVDEAGVICQVELELHYNPAVKRVMELVEEGAIGDVISFNATNITLSPVWAFPWQGVPELSYGSRVPLKPGDSRFRGGALSDHPHIFDLVRWIAGSDYNYVFSDAGDNIRTDLIEEDLLYVTGEMENGMKFLLDPSWSRVEERIKIPAPGWEVFPKRMEVNFTIVGTDGVIQADAFGPNVYFCGGPNNRYTIQYTYFDEWVGMMDELHLCVTEGKKPKIDLRWHKKTVEAMLNCYESIALGQPVFFK